MNTAVTSVGASIGAIAKESDPPPLNHSRYCYRAIATAAMMILIIPFLLACKRVTRLVGGEERKVQVESRPVRSEETRGRRNGAESINELQ